MSFPIFMIREQFNYVTCSKELVWWWRTGLPFYWSVFAQLHLLQTSSRKTTGTSSRDQTQFFRQTTKSRKTLCCDHTWNLDITTTTFTKIDHCKGNVLGRTCYVSKPKCSILSWSKLHYTPQPPSTICSGRGGSVCVCWGEGGAYNRIRGKGREKKICYYGKWMP